MVLSAYKVEHRGDGMGARFLSEIDERAVKWAAIIGLVPAILAGWTGIWAAAGGYFGAMCFRRFAESRLGTVNGDVIGAICELTEALVLLIACIK
jgi:adenosylcobinamide-GDP ribazoletransferase